MNYKFGKSKEKSKDSKSDIKSSKNDKNAPSSSFSAQIQKKFNDLNNNDSKTTDLNNKNDPKLKKLKSGGQLEVKVVLPNGSSHMQIVDPKKAIYDLLIELSSSARLLPTNYTLKLYNDADDERENELGKIIEYTPNQKIGQLRECPAKIKLIPKTATLKHQKLQLFEKQEQKPIKKPDDIRDSKSSTLKSKSKDTPKSPSFGSNWIMAVNKATSIERKKAFELTICVQVLLPFNQKTVVRVRQEILLEDLFLLICSENKLDKNKYDFYIPAMNESYTMMDSLVDFDTKEVGLELKKGKTELKNKEARTLDNRYQSQQGLVYTQNQSQSRSRQITSKDRYQANQLAKEVMQRSKSDIDLSFASNSPSNRSRGSLLLANTNTHLENDLNDSKISLNSSKSGGGQSILTKKRLAPAPPSSNQLINSNSESSCLSMHVAALQLINKKKYKAPAPPPPPVPEQKVLNIDPVASVKCSDQSGPVSPLSGISSNMSSPLSSLSSHSSSHHHDHIHDQEGMARIRIANSLIMPANMEMAKVTVLSTSSPLLPNHRKSSQTESLSSSSSSSGYEPNTEHKGLANRKENLSLNKEVKNKDKEDYNDYENDHILRSDHEIRVANIAGLNGEESAHEEGSLNNSDDIDVSIVHMDNSIMSSGSYHSNRNHGHGHGHLNNNSDEIEEAQTLKEHKKTTKITTASIVTTTESSNYYQNNHNITMNSSINSQIIDNHHAVTSCTGPIIGNSHHQKNFSLSSFSEEDGEGEGEGQEGNNEKPVSFSAISDTIAANIANKNSIYNYELPRPNHGHTVFSSEQSHYYDNHLHQRQHEVWNSPQQNDASTATGLHLNEITENTELPLEIVSSAPTSDLGPSIKLCSAPQNAVMPTYYTSTLIYPNHENHNKNNINSLASTFSSPSSSSSTSMKSGSEFEPESESIITSPRNLKKNFRPNSQTLPLFGVKQGLSSPLNLRSPTSPPPQFPAIAENQLKEKHQNFSVQRSGEIIEKNGTYYSTDGTVRGYSGTVKKMKNSTTLNEIFENRKELEQQHEREYEIEMQQKLQKELEKKQFVAAAKKSALVGSVSVPNNNTLNQSQNQVQYRNEEKITKPLNRQSLGHIIANEKSNKSSSATLPSGLSSSIFNPKPFCKRPSETRPISSVSPSGPSDELAKKLENRRQSILSAQHKQEEKKKMQKEQQQNTRQSLQIDVKSVDSTGSNSILSSSGSSSNNSTQLSPHHQRSDFSDTLPTSATVRPAPAPPINNHNPLFTTKHINLVSSSSSLSTCSSESNSFSKQINNQKYQNLSSDKNQNQNIKPFSLSLLFDELKSIVPLVEPENKTFSTKQEIRTLPVPMTTQNPRKVPPSTRPKNFNTITRKTILQKNQVVDQRDNLLDSIKTFSFNKLRPVI